MLNRITTTTCAAVIAASALGQDGPLKIRTIDVDLEASGLVRERVVVAVDPPVRVLPDAEVVLDAMRLVRSKTGDGVLGVRVTINVLSGGDVMGSAPLPEFLNASDFPLQHSTRRPRIALDGAGVIDGIEFVIENAAIEGSPADAMSRLTGLGGDPGMTVYVAYGANATEFRSAHTRVTLDAPPLLRSIDTGSTPWNAIDRTDLSEPRPGPIAYAHMGGWAADPREPDISAMIEARTTFAGVQYLFNDASAPSTGQAPPASESHAVLDNALAFDAPLSLFDLQTVEVRLTADHLSGGLVTYASSEPFEMSLYAEDWACYADANRDGILNIFDFLGFQNAFSEGHSYADCDSDGQLTIFDFLCFQNAFASGEACP